YVATIQSSLEAFLGGPAINRTITERAEAVAGMTRICLRQRPLVSVTSITAESSGAAVSITDVKIDANAGIIQRSTGWPFYGPLFMSLPWFNVIYVAGWGTQAPAVQQVRRPGAAELVGIPAWAVGAAVDRRRGDGAAAGVQLRDPQPGRRAPERQPERD